MNTSNTLFDTKDYKRSRGCYRFECAFEYFITILVTDAFLAKVLKSVGFTDAEVGVLSSIIALAFLFQLFSVFMVRKITNTKLISVLFHSLGQLFFVSLYLLPCMPFIPGEIKRPLAVICLLTAYFGNYMVTSMIYKWGNSYVAPNKRGRFTASKEILSLLIGMVISFAVGYIMDAFDAAGNDKGGFLFTAIAILIFCLSDFTMLMMIKNDRKERLAALQGAPAAPFSEVLRNTLGNKNFLSVMLLMILWECGRYFTIGFLGTYKTEDLGYTMALVQAINIVSFLGRAAFSRPFGKYADKHSFAKCIELGLLVCAVAFLAGIFTTPKTALLIIVYTVLYNVALAGVEGNLVNITYSYVDSRYFAEASAIKNSVAGLLGFLSSLLGGRILSAVQANGNKVFGYTVYGQQLLFAVSFLFFIAALLYTRLVIGKQRIMVQ